MLLGTLELYQNVCVLTLKRTGWSLLACSFTAWYQLLCGLTQAWVCSQGLRSRQDRAFPVIGTDTQERGMSTCPETLNTPPLALIVSHLFYSVAKTGIPVWGQVSPGRACDLGIHSDGTSGAPTEPRCTRRQRIAFTWYCNSALARGLNVSWASHP